MIEVINLEKTYTQGKTEFPALRGISFSIRSENMVSFVGKSGSGKSTLLHILGGLESITGGEVFVEQFNLKTLSQQQLSDFRIIETGFIFQSFSLNPHTL